MTGTLIRPRLTEFPNTGFHNLHIMTYDHVLIRAKRMIGVAVDDEDEIPF